MRAIRETLKYVKPQKINNVYKKLGYCKKCGAVQYKRGYCIVCNSSSVKKFYIEASFGTIKSILKKIIVFAVMFLSPLVIGEKLNVDNVLFSVTKGVYVVSIIIILFNELLYYKAVRYKLYCERLSNYNSEQINSTGTNGLYSVYDYFKRKFINSNVNNIDKLYSQIINYNQYINGENLRILLLNIINRYAVDATDYVDMDRIRPHNDIFDALYYKVILGIIKVVPHRMSIYEYQYIIQYYEEFEQHLKSLDNREILETKFYDGLFCAFLALNSLNSLYKNNKKVVNYISVNRRKIQMVDYRIVDEMLGFPGD